ncbi:MAG: M13 family metallopeptidase [Betaproteobacteria bacterium]|nr:M13 family metallopeptidase [Betaproteobacteria bacterium]
MSIMNLLRCGILAGVVLCSGCAEWPDTPAHSGIDMRWIDASVRPQDDLYRHISGRWLETAEIPPDRARYGAFDQIKDQTELRLRSLIEGLAAQADLAEDSNSVKMATLYRDFMDEATLAKQGVEPLKPWLDRIDAVNDPEALARLMAEFASQDVPVPLEPWVSPDARDATHYAVYVGQGGLGMPDRDYYLSDTDARLVAVRNAYRSYLQTLFSLAGQPQPALSAERTLALETALARSQWTKVENRDSIKTYNKYALADLQSRAAPEFDWNSWLETLQIAGHADALILRQPSYVKALGTLSRSLPLSDWKLYLKARLLDAYAPYLSPPFVQAQFHFQGTTVRGIPENRPRWKRGVAVVESAMGEALGQQYVQAFFPESSKERMQALVSYLLQAYRQSIESLSWMGPDTRKEALRKLDAIGTKIGYPNRWRDYSELKIRAGDLLGNLMRASEFETRRQIRKLGQPIDREEWGMTPQTVNAYYSPRMNEIVFPAAILQPPFFDPDADDAVNYGAIGAVIGHEISHAFDDQGSQSDGDGNLRNWWTDSDRARFKALTEALVRQYSAYSPIPGYHVNGQLTLGENIADNSGLAIAYKAYHLALGEAEAPVIDGLSGDQRFYCGWVQIWRNRMREAEALRLLKVDPHSPPAIRADGALVNQPGFQAAFSTKPGDKLYRAPADQVILW